jgi:putative phosphoribosyl transferase
MEPAVTTHHFHDRRDAGRLLATRLFAFAGEQPIVVGLPRGGIPVAYEVSKALRAPLEVFELERGARRYREERPMISLRGRTVIIVDDGIPTPGRTLAALQIARAQEPFRVVLAVPVAPRETVDAFRVHADSVITLATPSNAQPLDAWYDDFTPTTDAEVMALLSDAAQSHPIDPPRPTAQLSFTTPPPVRDGEVRIDVAGARLTGHLTLPEGAAGVVLFAHGSGSSRNSPRNIAVARVLNRAGLGTLLFDLLTHSEGVDRARVFDVSLLARRLRSTTTWLRSQPGCAPLRVGYFGASTGAAAALWAAAEPTADVAAIVSRGGRPDLAGLRLAAVRAPTLLIVGGQDHAVIECNRAADRTLTCEHRLEIVPGATHLFEESGTLERVAQLATDWFTEHLGAPDPNREGHDDRTTADR